MGQKSQLLNRVETSIAAGQLGIARQRLHTMVNLYPYDLTLRRRLGDVYAMLQYPERAGCYWYLEERKTPEMIAACEAFVRSCGGNPLVIVRTLKFRGGPESLPAGHARNVLEEFAKTSPDFRFPQIKEPQRKAREGDTFKANLSESLIVFGCLAAFLCVAVGLLVVFIAGMMVLKENGLSYLLP